MPTAAGEPPITRAQRVHQEAERGSSKKRKKKETRQFPTYRKAYRGDIRTEKNEDEDKKKREDKLLEEVADCLKECSRQRLRAVHMSMRQYGNEASRISSKDVIRSLQNNGVEIHDGLLQAMFARFEDGNGILQLEVLYKYLVEAHSKTDRDSVAAERTRNNILPLCVFRPEDVDEDLIWRIQDLLVKSRSYIDISELREAFKLKSNQDTAKVDVSVARQICLEHDMPVYGALLTNLMKRCGAEKSDKLDWLEFLSFLEKGQENALKTCPDLKHLSEKEKNQTPIEPNILDELSSRTKSTLVSKLRKKASIKRQEANDAKHKEPVQAKNKDIITQEQSDNEEFLSIAKDFYDNAVRAEPNVEVNETNVVTKNDSKDSVVSANTGTQVIIDIIPPSKEPTLYSDDEGENEDKSTDVILNNDDSTDIREDATLVEELNKIINSVDHSNVDEDDQIESLADREEIHAEINKAAEISTWGTVNVDVETVTLDLNSQAVALEGTGEFNKDQGPNLPTQNLRMQWVYGYRGNDCRKNIHVLASGEIVYFMSYIAIIYNKQKHTQRHYTEHTDEIKCIDIHSDGLTVATGQFASRKDGSIQAHVRLWHAESLQTLNILGMGEIERAVACLAFSPGKNMLAAVDNSPEKKLLVWDIISGEKKGETTLQTELICDIGICKKDPDTVIAVGKDHITWWKIDHEHRTIQNTAKPNYEDNPQAKFVICLAFSDKGDIITGDSNGSIYVWEKEGNKISSCIKHAHDGAVFTLLCREGYLLSGGRDGILHCWNIKDMATAGFLQLPPADGGIRMLQTFENNLIIGTTMNSMHLVCLGDDSDELPLSLAVIDSSPITQCHYDDLRGLTVTPKSVDYNVLTAGQDGIICAIDTNSCTAVSRIQMKGNQYLCIDAGDKGNLVALGTKDGCIHIFHHSTDGKWQELFSQKVCKDRLTVIRISPDQRYIAAGCQDSNIYVLACHLKTWEYYDKLEGQQSTITGIDWLKPRANEKLFLRSGTSSFERRYWDPITKTSIPEENIPSGSKWLTQTCGVDVQMLSIPASTTDVEVLAIDVNNTLNLVAVADTRGYLRLIRYPCSKPDVSSNSYKSPATIRNLRFTDDGRHLLTVGGRDSCLIQWKVD